jgi:hypothetical protein
MIIWQVGIIPALVWIGIYYLQKRLVKYPR